MAWLIYICFYSCQISNKVLRVPLLSILAYPLQFSLTRRGKNALFLKSHAHIHSGTYNLLFLFFLQFLAIDTSSGVGEFLLERRKSLCLRYESQNCCKEYPALGRVVRRHCFEKILNLGFCATNRAFLSFT